MENKNDESNIFGPDFTYSYNAAKKTIDQWFQIDNIDRRLDELMIKRHFEESKFSNYLGCFEVKMEKIESKT